MKQEYEHIVNEIDVYKGIYYKNKKYKNINRVMVFDLDETLGCFLEFDILWYTIQQIVGSSPPISHTHLLDLYPEFLRPNIIDILKYVNKKKKTGECQKLYIYTNNQSQSYSVNMIADYLSNKVEKNNYALFDQIIYAFKINNQIVQIGRSTHKKTHDDLINCTLLPKKTAICFIDDIEFDEMKKERIYYIQPKAYFHKMNSYDILNRLFSSKYKFALQKYEPLIRDQFLTRSMKINIFKRNIRDHSKYIKEQEIVSKKMMYHIREFFFSTRKRNKTQKQNKTTNKFTRKSYIKN